MATSRQRLINIHSSVLNKQPKPEVLSVGELAVNNHAENEFISTLNTEGEVVRFSNDLTQVERMEDKEVFPYEGKIDNIDLENNRSNLEIKLNQKAAKQMRHYDVVNDAKDIDGNPINPSSDGGVTDGAGFAVDTSIFAMNGSNPSFKTLEVTCETNLSGTTNINGGEGECGSNLNINVTNVSGNVTNTTYEGDNITIVIPNERISACTEFTVDSDAITLQQCEAGGTMVVKEDNTVVSGKNLTVKEDSTISVTSPTVSVSGTNLNVKETSVSVMASGNVTVTAPATNVSGNTMNITEDETTVNSCDKFDVNSDAINLKQCGTDGKLVIDEKTTEISGSNLNIVEDSGVSISSCAGVDIKTDSFSLGSCTEGEGEINLHAKNVCLDAEDGVNVGGKASTNVGVPCGDGGRSLHTYVMGETLNVEASSMTAKAESEITVISPSASTTITSETKTVTDGTVKYTNTLSASAKTMTLSGNTLSVEEATSISATTPTMGISGTDLTVSETNTDITSCGRFKVDSDAITLEECGNNGKITIKEKAAEISGTTLDVNEGTSVSVKTPTATVSGTNLNVNEANVNVTATTKTDIKSPATTLSGTSLSIDEANINVNASTKADIKSPATTLSGTSLNVTETDTTVQSCGSIDLKSDDITLEECTAGAGNITFKAKDLCLSGSNSVNVYGNNDTNLGVSCDGSSASTRTTLKGSAITESANTISETAATSITEKAPTITLSGTTNNNNFTTVNNTATAINNNTTNYNITGTTKINGDTTIQSGLTVSGNTVIGGNTYMSGKTYFNNTCDAVEANELSDALCEVFNRSIVTMEKTTPDATSEILATYKLFQDGKQIGEDINIPKDHLLKDVSIVYGTVNGTSFTQCTSAGNDCHWYIKLVWNVFDPQSGHSDDKTTYLLADDFIKDIDDDNSKADRGVNVDVWYDGQMNRVSADTTVVIKNADGGGTKTFGKSNGTHTLSAYTLNMVSGDVKSDSALTNWTYDPFDKKVTVTTPTDVSHVNRNTLTVNYGDVRSEANKTYDPGSGTANTSRSTTIVIPSDASHIANRNVCWEYGDVKTASGDCYAPSQAENGKIVIPQSTSDINKETLTLQAGSFSPASYNTESAVTVNIPTDASHISSRGVCWTYGDVKSATGSCYNPSQSSDGAFVIPQSTSDINRKSLTWSNGAANTGTYDTTAEAEINIPSLLSHLDGGVITNNDGCLTIDKDICVNGNVTATHFYESSDERLKENIEKAGYDDLEKAKNVEIKSFNFKGEENKTIGVIAQDVENEGLDFCVVEGEDGYKKVDYTSLILLKLAYLEKELRLAKVEIKNLKEELRNK